MIRKYKKELRVQRAVKNENKNYGWDDSHDRNLCCIAHGKIKILNMVIKDLNANKDLDLVSL